MIRILGAVCIVISCACMGIAADRRILGRCKSISYFISAMNYLKINTAFGNMDMKSALIASDKACGVESVFSKTAQELQSLGITEAWERALRDSQNDMSLTSEDMELLLPFGKNIGLIDIDAQNKSIDNMISLLNVRYDEAKSQYTKKGRLYGKCGILAGIFTVLVLL